MKYLCLIHDDEAAWAKLPKEEIDRVMGEYASFTEDIQRSGHFVGGEQLAPSTTATTVRVRNGRTVVTDGPFVETKEQLGGFYVVEARDLNEAIQIAARIPSAQFGAIEVRPVVPAEA